MKYLKLFETETQYESWKSSEDYILPNVSYCIDGNLYYNQIKPLEEIKLCANDPGNISSEGAAIKIFEMFSYAKTELNLDSMDGITIYLTDDHPEYGLTGDVKNSSGLLLGNIKNSSKFINQPVGLYVWFDYPGSSSKQDSVYSIKIGRYISSGTYRNFEFNMDTSSDYDYWYMKVYCDENGDLDVTRANNIYVEHYRY